MTLSLVLPPDLPPGAYGSRLVARVGSSSESSVDILFEVEEPPSTEGVASVVILGEHAPLRQGDVTAFSAEVRDVDGVLLDAPVLWSVVPEGAGFFGSGGRFVGMEAGAAFMIARSGPAADTISVTIAPRGLDGSFTVVGRGMVTSHFTSDLWVHGDHAYTGTWGNQGNSLFAWDVSDPANPVRTSTVVVAARTVNDVKVRSDGTMAVITHEGSPPNGVTLLDLADPARPSVIGRFSQGLESGVHNTWFEGDYVYLVLNGIGNGMRVLDVSDPANPRVVSSFYGGASFLHDVYVRDGLAFLSHWDAGLIILDVGNGMRGGSPINPVEVSRIRTTGGQTHNAWYWPEGGYVFVGEEDFSTPGIMHVVDVRDITRPKEVATFRVAGDTPHNFWMDEEAELLYLAWYGGGIRALDVSGELLGELDRQGREIAFSRYNGAAAAGSCIGSGTCTWAPQLHDGLIFVSDMNAGLLILRPEP